MMHSDDILEYGRVKETKKGIAVVTLESNDNCEECSAKIFCKTNDNKERELTVRDEIGVSEGSVVLIAVSGRQLLNVSFLLYGLPLLLLTGGIIAGYFLFSTDREMYSALLGLSAVTIYFLAFSKREKKKERLISKIVSKLHD